MNLPTPVYEYLPSIYVICGGLLLANFDNGLGKSAAMILIFTGVVESGPAEGNYIWEHGDLGWQILAICVQPDQRRPDYVLGKAVMPSAATDAL